MTKTNIWLIFKFNTHLYMKKEKEKKEVVLPDSVVRLLEFVESHGGPAKVARTMGTSPQIFYNYRNGLSKPGTDVYMDIKRSYPEFDANYVLFGQDSGNAFHPEPDQGLEKENEYLRRENGLLRALAEAKGAVLPKYKGVTNSPKLDEIMKRYNNEKPNYLTLAFAYINPN